MMYELANHLGEPLSTVLAMTEDEFNHWWTFLRIRNEKIDGNAKQHNPHATTGNR